MQNRTGSTLAQVKACCLHAWQHQAITWTNFDSALVKFCIIHLKANSQRMLKLSFCIMNLEIMFLILLPHLPGANEFIY